MSSEFVEVIEAQYYGDPNNQVHQINKFLSKHIKSKKSVLELMADDNGCKIIPKFNFIISPAGTMIFPGQLFEAYNMINTGGIRCSICKEILNLNTILAHLQGNYQKGHNLSTEKTIKLFGREFYNWEFSNGVFRYGGTKVETI